MLSMFSLGKCKLKITDITTHPLKWLKFKILSNRKLHVLLVGVQKVYTRFGKV